MSRGLLHPRDGVGARPGRPAVVGHPATRDEALEACAVLEGAVVARAAERRTAAEAAALLVEVDGLEAAVHDPRAFVARDLALRGRIADASHSRYLACALRVIHHGLHDVAHVAAGRHTAAERLAHDVAERRSLVDAIVQGDRDAAVRSLERILHALRR